MSGNKNILFLVPYPVGEAPSQRFRFEQYFVVLEKNGYSIKAKSFIKLETWKVLYQRGKIGQKVLSILWGYIRRWKHVLFDVPKADFVFIHREAAPLGPPVFEYVIANLFKKKVIYDFDDAIWLPNTSDSNKWVAQVKWHQKTGKICEWSWKVSTGNDFLATYAKEYNDRVIVNPTTIDTDYHYVSEKQEKEKLVIGWTGTHSTLKYLEDIFPEIESVQADHKFTLRVISNRPPETDFDFVEFIKWNKETEVEDLSVIDIGLMPLREDRWSQGKCGFKALQYMALKIPVLLSPVGVNKKIVTEGKNGYFCSSSKDWVSHMATLLQSSEKRIAMGEDGREIVYSNYSVISNKEKFLSLFTE